MKARVRVKTLVALLASDSFISCTVFVPQRRGVTEKRGRHQWPM